MDKNVELPPADHHLEYDNEDIVAGDYYSAEQVRAAILAERQRCAVIAEDHENWRDNPAHVIAAKIRAGTP